MTGRIDGQFTRERTSRTRTPPHSGSGCTRPPSAALSRRGAASPRGLPPPDRFSYDGGELLGLDEAEDLSGFERVERCDPRRRRGRRCAPASTGSPCPGASLSLPFEGRRGPLGGGRSGRGDLGLSRGRWPLASEDLFTRWSGGLHLPCSRPSPTPGHTASISGRGRLHRAQPGPRRADRPLRGEPVSEEDPPRELPAAWGRAGSWTHHARPGAQACGTPSSSGTPCLVQHRPPSPAVARRSRAPSHGCPGSELPAGPTRASLTGPNGTGEAPEPRPTGPHRCWAPCRAWVHPGDASPSRAQVEPSPRRARRPPFPRLGSTPELRSGHLTLDFGLNRSTETEGAWPGTAVWSVADQPAPRHDVRRRDGLPEMIGRSTSADRAQDPPRGPSASGCRAPARDEALELRVLLLELRGRFISPPCMPPYWWRQR